MEFKRQIEEILERCKVYTDNRDSFNLFTVSVDFKSENGRVVSETFIEYSYGRLNEVYNVRIPIRELEGEIGTVKTNGVKNRESQKTLESLFNQS